MEAKRQVYVADDDTTYDDELTRIIQAAREQWEHDTDSAVLTQTLKMYSSGFGVGDFPLYKKPIQSVSSVKYFDPSGVEQTLSTSVYSLDAGKQTIRLKINQAWPTVEISRWDAVSVTYIAGYTSLQAVPAIVKQALLLLVTYYFFANRGDNDRPNDQRAYEMLVRRYMRSSYP